MRSYIDDVPVTISQSTSLNLPLTLPFVPTAAAVLPGTTFFSLRADSDDPWCETSPFEPESLQSISVRYRNDDGGAATFHSSETKNSTTASEHLSVEFGISIGCPWLGANVTGGYDKDTLENQDARKASMRASFRAGSIIMERQPRLSAESCRLLKYGGGITALQQRFGDYYVAGYRLGGDAGMLLSESKARNQINERLSVKVEATALFVTCSKQHQKFFASASASSQYRVHGFDTLTQLRIPPEAPVQISAGSDFTGLMGTVKDLETRCIKLAERTTKEIELLGLEHEEALDMAMLAPLLQTHLVVEVLLLPICKMREVIHWTTCKDII